MPCDDNWMKPSAASAHHFRLLLRCSMHRQGNWSSGHLLKSELRVSRPSNPFLRLQHCVVPSPRVDHRGRPALHSPLYPGFLGSSVWGTIAAGQGRTHTVCRLGESRPLAFGIPCRGHPYPLPGQMAMDETELGLDRHLCQRSSQGQVLWRPLRNLRGPKATV
jgi:hypothetical protein